MKSKILKRVLFAAVLLILLPMKPDEFQAITEDDVKKMFISACKIPPIFMQQIDKVKEKIYVVFYNENSSHKLFALNNC